jgi:hypothetical protein
MWWGLAGAGCVHDDLHTGQAQGGASQVVAVGPEAVDGHASGQRAGHKEPAVGGQDAAEVWVRLEGGHEPVEPERQDAGAGAPRLRVSD